MGVTIGYVHLLSSIPCLQLNGYAYGEVTSHIRGRNTISILWGNTVVLCVVKW